jgi:hypothetical protein
MHRSTFPPDDQIACGQPEPGLRATASRQFNAFRFWAASAGVRVHESSAVAVLPDGDVSAVMGGFLDAPVLGDGRGCSPDRAAGVGDLKGDLATAGGDLAFDTDEGMDAVLPIGLGEPVGCPEDATAGPILAVAVTVVAGDGAQKVEEILRLASVCLIQAVKKPPKPWCSWSEPHDRFAFMRQDTWSTPHLNDRALPHNIPLKQQWSNQFQQGPGHPSFLEVGCRWTSTEPLRMH